MVRQRICGHVGDELVVDVRPAALALVDADRLAGRDLDQPRKDGLPARLARDELRPGEGASVGLELTGDADLLCLESPSNPLLAVAGLAGICAAPRKPDALVVVDSTFATPL